jgi:hypothetical protein
MGRTKWLRLAPVNAPRTVEYDRSSTNDPWGLIMKFAARPNRMNIDLQGYKQPWLDYCKARGVTPSEAFRQVVAKLTAANSNDQAAPVEATDEPVAKIRREIRLTSAEVRRAEVLAEQAGFSLNRWIVALVRARLDGSHQLGQHELEALARSNLQMLAIGRNLNQLAKVANGGVAGVGPALAPVIEALNQVVTKHAQKVSAVMAMNVARWRLK